MTTVTKHNIFDYTFFSGRVVTVFKTFNHLPLIYAGSSPFLGEKLSREKAIQ